MSKNRIAPAAVLAAVLAAALMSSCIPPARITPSWERWKVYLDMMVTFRVVDECRLVDASGNDVEKIVVAPSTPIRWVNDSTLPAVIEFSDYDIVGRWSVLLNPGAEYTTTLRSDLDPDEDYRVRVLCKGEEVIEGPTPPIEEEEPKP
jgi:hypothetical protein